jgi:hypothetical protein
MIVFRVVITQGVTTLPLEMESCLEIKAKVKAAGFGLVTLMEQTWGSWIAGNLHSFTWLHLQSGHSIAPCKTW